MLDTRTWPDGGFEAASPGTIRLTACSKPAPHLVVKLRCDEVKPGDHLADPTDLLDRIKGLRARPIELPVTYKQAAPPPDNDATEAPREAQSAASWSLRAIFQSCYVMLEAGSFAFGSPAHPHSSAASVAAHETLAPGASRLSKEGRDSARSAWKRVR